MHLPVEIIEHILRKCHGKTLLTARKVNYEWKSMVDYLTERTRIWEFRCQEEIPKNELVEYVKWYKEDDDKKWLHIFINWCSWEDINHVVCDIILSPVEVPRISSMAVSDEFITLGSHDGRLWIFNSHWEKLFNSRILAVKIASVTFIESHDGTEDIDIEESRTEADVCIVISYHKGLQIICFDGVGYSQIMIGDVKSHSVYKNYICYEKNGGRVTLGKLSSFGRQKQLTEIWFSRIYSPSSLSCMKMWEGVCTFLINNEVKTVEYESHALPPMDTMKKKTRIRFNFPLVDSQYTQILRNDVIISLCKNDDDVKCDLIEFFILGGQDQYSKKMFSTWEIFRCYITCIYLYGNTLILGMDVGTVYIYHVSRWKNLDIREYNHKLIIGKHPIIAIDAKETPNERRFYVSSQFNIHEVTGFLPNVY